jgi:hypothetical protein
MFKIPVIDAPSVAPNNGPEAGVYRYQADNSMSQALTEAGRNLDRGFNQLGQGVSASQRQMREEEQKALAEADAVAEADAMIALDAANAKSLEFLRQQRGRDASAESAATIESFDKNRRDIAERLTPRQKARFLARSAESVISYRRSAETHVSKEFEAAREGTMKARMGQALAQTEAGVLDFDTWLATSRSAEQDIRANARSPEEADAAVEAFQSSMSFALVKSLLAKRDFAGAKAFMDGNRKSLGGQAEEADRLYAQATEAQRRDDLAARALATVDDAARRARAAGDGYITDTELRELVDVNQFDAEEQPRIAQALEQRARVEAARTKDAIEHHRSEINKADLHGTPVPGDSEAFLERHDDAGWLLARKKRLEAERRTRILMANRAANPKAAKDAEREQKQLDKEFLSYLQGELTDNPNADVDQLLVDWINRVSEREGKGVTISDLAKQEGLTAAKKKAANEASDEGKALNRNERDFKSEIEKAVHSTLKTKRGGKVDESFAAELVNSALQRYRSDVEAKGGKPLTAEEMASIRAEAVRKSSEGGFFGIGAKTVYGAQSFKPYQPTTVKMRFKRPDGSTFEESVPAAKVSAAKRKGGVVLDGR